MSAQTEAVTALQIALSASGFTELAAVPHGSFHVQVRFSADQAERFAQYLNAIYRWHVVFDAEQLRDGTFTVRTFDLDSTDADYREEKEITP